MSKAGGYDEYGFVAEFYDHIGPYQNRPDIDFFVNAANDSEGSVLEVGCGTGRILIPTAREGIEIWGLDLSPQMIGICRQQLENEAEDVRSKVQLVEADMRDFELRRKFQLITTPFRPFQHLTTTEDQISCLRRIHAHLDDEGEFILDIFNPSVEGLGSEIGEEVGEEPEIITPDGRRMIRFHKIVARDYYKQINHVELIYYVTYPDGKKERLVHSFPMKYIFRFEAEHLLVRCGFEVKHIYADYDKAPYGSKYPGELIFVAGKA